MVATAFSFKIVRLIYVFVIFPRLRPIAGLGVSPNIAGGGSNVPHIWQARKKRSNPAIEKYAYAISTGLGRERERWPFLFAVHTPFLLNWRGRHLASHAHAIWASILFGPLDHVQVAIAGCETARVHAPHASVGHGPPEHLQVPALGSAGTRQ